MSEESGSRRPNVVFVLTDDQGYGDLGCHGNSVIRTPNIDRHHADAVRFVDFHVGTTCAPTRAGLFTGHWCNSTGVWHTIGGHSLLREDEWTLADALRGVGYRTGLFGKWHLGDSPPFRPHERGFEETVYHAGGGIGNTGDPWGNDYFDDTYFVNGVPTPHEGYCTEVFFREGMRFIRRHAREPFLCVITTNAPHQPLNVEPRYWEPYRAATPHEHRARFYGMISAIDEGFGRLRTLLDELALSDRTIVVFMTDNGTDSGIELDPMGFPLEGPGSCNAGMRGKKGWPYEGGHRVPFLLRYPAGGAVGGRDIDTLTSYVDFMPTILDLCGVAVPAERRFHGRSLVPLMAGERGGAWDERVIVSDTQRVARPVKWRKSSAMRSTWRLVNGTELYDLKTDPGQHRDIAAERPQEVARLRASYEEWWRLVSQQLDRDTPIAIGATEEPVRLTAHDLRNEACNVVWNHRQVREGVAVSGTWMVDVRRRGRYRIELRRWPEEAGHALQAGIQGDDVPWREDCVPVGDVPHYRGGVSLPIRWAQVAIGGHSVHAEAAQGSSSVAINLELEEGQQELFASFYDDRERSIAPYYVCVKPLDVVSRRQ